MKNTLFYIRLGYQKYPVLFQVGLSKIPCSICGWVIKNTLFYFRLGYQKYPVLFQVGLSKIPCSISGWVIKNTLFYFRLGYQKYPILGYEICPVLSQVGLWKIPYSISGWVMKNTLFCCNSAEYSSCDPVNLASPWRRIKEVSLMAMRTTASSKGICILRFSMLSIHVVVYRLYPTYVHLTSSNTAGEK